MIDLAMVFSARRRRRIAAALVSRLPRFPGLLLRRAAFALGSCAAMAACSAQNDRTSVAVNAADPAVASSAVKEPSVLDVEAKTGGSGVAPQALAALTKPVAIIGRGVSAAGRKVATVGVGLASWYGGAFHGRRTANGEQFDMEALTAAHPSLPLPSYVRVTNVSNGRSVVVRVNDRGPFHGGRLIDVSRRTADVLGFRGSGVGNVKVDYVGPANAGDDRKLIATYQEFGRPAAPEGMQMAALHPVSETELMGRPPAATLASAPTAMPVGLGSPNVAVAAYAPQAAEPAASALGQPLKTATARPTATEPVLGAQPRPATVQVASLPSKTSTAKADELKVDVAEAVAPKQAKRVVRPADPVLASVTPAFAGVTPQSAVAGPTAGVSARIAASFDEFNSFKPAPEPQGAAAFNGLR